MLTAALIFTATYVVVALGRMPGLRLDRTGAAVVGAAFVVAFRVVSPDEAYRFVDLGTLVLLFGMMVIVGHLRLAMANMIVAEGARRASPLTFAEYLKVGVPVTLLTLAVGVFMLS